MLLLGQITIFEFMFQKLNQILKIEASKFEKKDEDIAGVRYQITCK